MPPVSKPLKSSYDIIVCGGGTSGCVLAGRLAENPDLDILLIEAGGDERVPAVIDSRVWMTNIGSERDWCFQTEPAPALNHRTAPMPMGRVLGGGSSINGLVWARGHKADYEHWAAETGDAGWGYDSVVATYKDIEDWRGPANPRLRGTGGPIHIALPPDPVPVARALVQASVAAGIPEAEDLNAETMEGDGGCGIPNVTVEGTATRVSMASAFIRPRMGQSNLTVALGATAHRLLLSGTRCTGVEIELAGEIHRVLADLEVVLSTGAINTPKLLMLSGIGDEAQLQRHGIPVVQHLPGVGQNFQDHILVGGCVWRYRVPEPPRNNSAEFTLFCKSAAHLPSPDLQPILEEKAFGSEVTAPRFDLPTDTSACWTLAPGLIRPQSRGHLELTGDRPQDRIRIHANFLAEQADVDALLTCIDLCREIGNAPALAEFSAGELMPGPLNRREMTAFLRDAAGTYFHETCTAKMGRDALSVVDGSLRVYGIERLRIADGSVMPSIASGNTMAPCAMIGARASTLIRQTHSV